MKTTNFTKQIDSICDINLEHTENAPKIDNDRIHSLAINKINEEGGFVRRNTLAWQFMPMATAMVVILGMSVIGLNLLKPENVVMEYGELQDTSSTAVSSSSNSSNTSPMVGSEGFIPKGGLIAEHDGWIYFNDKHSFKQSGFMDNGALKNTINLAKSRPDGSEKQILDGNIYDVGNIIVPGDGWVYYNRLGSENQWIGTENKHEKENGIFRIREDGTALSKISTSSVRSSFVIENDRIFFTVESYLLQMNDEVFDTTSGNLYSMKTDGTDVKILVEYDMEAQQKERDKAIEKWFEENPDRCAFHVKGFGHSDISRFDDAKYCDKDHGHTDECTSQFGDWEEVFASFPAVHAAFEVQGIKNGWLYYLDGRRDLVSKVCLSSGEMLQTNEQLFTIHPFFDELGYLNNKQNFKSDKDEYCDDTERGRKFADYSTHTVFGDYVYFALSDGTIRKINIDGNKSSEVTLAQFPRELFATSFSNHIVDEIYVYDDTVYLQTSIAHRWGDGHHARWRFEIDDDGIAVPKFIDGIVE